MGVPGWQCGPTEKDRNGFSPQARKSRALTNRQGRRLDLLGSYIARNRWVSAHDNAGEIGQGRATLCVMVAFRKGWLFISSAGSVAGLAGRVARRGCYPTYP